MERLHDQRTQDAEIAAYFGDHGKSTTCYQEHGRLDLALQLFMRLGLWSWVEALLKVQMRAAFINIIMLIDV